MEVIDMKQNLKESFFRLGSVLFLLCLLLPIVAQANDANEIVCINATTANVSATTANISTLIANVSAPIADVSTSTANISTSSVTVSSKSPILDDVGLLLAAIVILLIFGWLIYIGAKADKKLDKGEMRKAIAGTFVVGFSMLMILSIKYDIADNNITTMYVQLAGIVVAFYFGARAVAAKQAEAAAMIGIEHVRFLPDPKKIAITIRNGSDSEINVDKIYINEGAIEESIKISPEKSKETKQTCEWQAGTEYNIKIATTTGLTAEIQVSPPGENSDT
uniref:Uncharacterized protein n=1 Tax=Candidatus Methanogaster sp. ANME-2c ERB4 TaxID=2759911 RepID=A0A7G9YLM7_9EURY|nr:hypothetical protein MOGPJHGO_00014 [Methanosarcinales archaeon ANME-2c ERB4]